MKAQFGLLYRDERQASNEDLAILLGKYATAQTETAGELITGSLAIAYRGDRLTWEEENETQPFRSGSLILTFDGRLDNREEWLRRLGVRNPVLPDPEIVLQAYQLWGDNIFRELIGEFALVLWSESSKTLLFVRSTCGARPLFYAPERDRIVWSSDFAHLTTVSRADCTIDRDYIVQYLVSYPPSNLTPFTSVKAVPANSICRFTDGQLSGLADLWNPNQISTLGNKSDTEYEEICRMHLRDAVRARMRTKYPIFSELSGGLDSSTLVMLGDELLRVENRPTSDLRTLSLVYDDSETCDERYFIQSIEQARNTVGHHVPETAQRATLGLTSINFSGLPNYLHCYPGRYETFTQIMKAAGARVLMTGSGGDHVFWSIRDGAPVIADHLRRARLIAAHQECCQWSRLTGVPYLSLLLRDALPLALRSTLHKPSNYLTPIIPHWLTSSSKKQAADLFSRAQVRNVGAPPNCQARLRVVQSLFDQLASGSHNEYSDIYITYPYTHRPLVEFCLSVPMSQHLRDGEMRSLMRRSFCELLPARVLTRRSKASSEEFFIRTLRKEWQTIGNLRSWRLCEYGLVDPEKLLPTLERIRAGLNTNSPVPRVFVIERWLRSLENFNSSRTPPHIDGAKVYAC